MDNVIPSDSVLRRHYEATHGKTTQTKSTSDIKENNSGIMCWLKKLFGG